MPLASAVGVETFASVPETLRIHREDISSHVRFQRGVEREQLRFGTKLLVFAGTKVEESKEPRKASLREHVENRVHSHQPLRPERPSSVSKEPCNLIEEKVRAGSLRSAPAEPHGDWFSSRFLII